MSQYREQDSSSSLFSRHIVSKDKDIIQLNNNMQTFVMAEEQYW